ncbi:hypothetical protein BJ912DRAFT_1065573 [Pholiota molesta]|nr:hypothetical protein BJ912DRAFT_1065573 [Pholiota molesta]
MAEPFGFVGGAGLIVLAPIVFLLSSPCLAVFGTSPSLLGEGGKVVGERKKGVEDFANTIEREAAAFGHMTPPEISERPKDKRTSRSPSQPPPLLNNNQPNQTLPLSPPRTLQPTPPTPKLSLTSIAIAQVLEVLPEIDRVYLARMVRASMPALGADTGERVLGRFVESGAWPREGRVVHAGSANAPSAAAAAAAAVAVADRVLCHLSGSVTALPPASHA